jgi:hypothetical protein
MNDPTNESRATRGPALPIDPVIRSWVTEAGLHQDGAWIYLGTPGRTISSADPQLILDMVYHHPSSPGAYQSQLILPSDQLEAAWDGYRLELLGGVRRLNEDGFQITPNTETGARGPSFRVLNAAGDVWLEVELWHQRCFQQSGPDDIDVPPLIAEIHWWPESIKQQPFFRITTGHPDHLKPNDMRQARRDWALLDNLDLSVHQGGRHRIGNDPTDGELELARQAKRLRKESPTWTWLRIVNHIGLVSAIEDEGRSRDPEAAALERLRRWRKRLRELGE